MGTLYEASNSSKFPLSTRLPNLEDFSEDIGCASDLLEPAELNCLKFISI